MIEDYTMPADPNIKDAFKNLTIHLVSLTKTLLDLPDSEVPSLRSEEKPRLQDLMEEASFSDTSMSQSVTSIGRDATLSKEVQKDDKEHVSEATIVRSNIEQDSRGSQMSNQNGSLKSKGVEGSQKSIFSKLNSLCRITNASIFYQSTKHHKETNAKINVYGFHVGYFR